MIVCRNLITLISILFISMLLACGPMQTTSCLVNDTEGQMEVSLGVATDSMGVLTASPVAGAAYPENEWELKCKAFKLECGDINRDEKTDILVGVIKTTRFDSVMRKRLFIFKLFRGYVRPLWLGSRLSQPLEDFRVVADSIVRTVEVEQSGKYLVAEYEWKGFGLDFVAYLKREQTFTDAERLLYSD